MQALEELAVSYDTKDREIGSVFNEKQMLTQENERVQVSPPPPSLSLTHTHTHTHTHTPKECSGAESDGVRKTS